MIAAKLDRKIYFNLFLIFFISACNGVSEYKKPETDIEKDWSSLKSDSDNNVDMSDVNELDKNWWKKFNDDVLSSLIDKAVEYNKDIKSAGARIDEAEALLDSSNAQLFPEITGSLSSDRVRLGESSGNKVDSNLKAGINGSLSLDIFGKKRIQIAASKANSEYAKYSLDYIKIKIISDVTAAYINMRLFQKQKGIILKNIKMQTETLDIIKGQRKLGAVSDFELVRAEAQLESTKALLPDVNTSAMAAVNRLRVLTGQSSEDILNIMFAGEDIPQLDGNMIAITPIQLIENRPDIKASEMQFKQVSALKDFAKAKRLPDISIEGFLASQDSQVFGAANPWGVTLGMLFPILNFGRISADIKAAEARKDEAYYNYQQTVLLAVEDVENSFLSYMNEKKRYKSLKSIFDKYKKAAIIAKEKYKVGVIGQLDLLLAQQNELEAENNLVKSEAMVSEKAAKLFFALGI